jgi:hypothetical protein
MGEPKIAGGLCAQEDPNESRFTFLPPDETGDSRTHIASACRTNFLEESCFRRRTEDGFGPPSPRGSRLPRADIATVQDIKLDI